MQLFADGAGNIDWTDALDSAQTLDFAAQSNLFWPVYVGLLLLTTAGVWATFVKAGQSGWACLVPFYNLMVMLKIVRKHPLWIAAFLLPLANILFACFVAIRLARLFGKGTAFGLGLVLLPFIYYPILGFGSAKYQTPGAATNDVMAPVNTPGVNRLPYRKAG